MRKFLWLAFLVAFAGGAWAQNGTGYTPPPGLPAVGGVVSIPVVFNSTVSANGASGFQINGQTVLNVTHPTGAGVGVLIGPFTGASAPANTLFLSGTGAYNFESATQGEATAGGMGAGISCQNCGGSSLFGVNAGASFINDNLTAFGSDACRDLLDIYASICIGTAAAQDGIPTGTMVILGTESGVGNAGLITFGTGPTTGDVKKFTISTSNPCGTINCTTLPTPAFVTYTVQAGDTPSTIATAVAAALLTLTPTYTLGDGANMGAHNIIGFAASVADTNHTNVVAMHFPSSWAITITYSCTGTCSDIVTVAPASANGNITLIGNGIFTYKGNTGSIYDVIVGSNSFGPFASGITAVATLGQAIAPNAGPGSGNIAAVGSQALNNCGVSVACQYQAVLGAFAGYGVTGIGNTIVGDESAASSDMCITSGQFNLELAAEACVPSPTANGQMSIQNIIYGTGNVAQGTSVSTGSIGIGQKTPGARFDILGTDTSTTLAFRVLNSASVPLISVADNGVSTFAAGGVVINGASSGASTIQAPATGGGVATLPAGSGTLAYSSGTPQQAYSCAVPLTTGVGSSTLTCFMKAARAFTVDNITATVAGTLVTVTPSVFECGTSTTCATPTTIGSGAVTASNTATPITVASAAIAAGDYIAVELTAGTVTSVAVNVQVEMH